MISSHVRKVKSQGATPQVSFKKADKIREFRNAAVHKLKQFSSEETYKAIIATKELTEKVVPVQVT